MIQLSRLEKNERALRAVTGLSKAEFEELHKKFEKELEKEYTKKCKDPNRQRKPGGGSKPILSSKVAQLIFILVYWTCYPTQDLQGFLFDMTPSAAHTWIYRLLKILEGALGAAVVLPARPATSTLEQLNQECPELEVVIDGVERPIIRSHDSAKQKEDYSGKKKRHTKKNIVITRKKTKKIVILGNTHTGKTHDKKAADQDDLKLPQGSKQYQDTGFQGYEPDGVETIQPKKNRGVVN